jgi:hypothetical protein
LCLPRTEWFLLSSCEPRTYSVSTRTFRRKPSSDCSRGLSGLPCWYSVCYRLCRTQGLRCRLVHGQGRAGRVRVVRWRQASECSTCYPLRGVRARLHLPSWRVCTSAVREGQLQQCDRSVCAAAVLCLHARQLMLDGLCRTNAVCTWLGHCGVWGEYLSAVPRWDVPVPDWSDDVRDLHSRLFLHGRRDCSVSLSPRYFWQ